MTIPRTLLGSTTAILALSLAGPLAAQTVEPIPVVATFSILGDMIEHIGGEQVAVTTLVGPEGDTHVYQPTPADARAVSDAQVLIVNGLDFEGWLDRLVDAADFDGERVAATDGIDPIAYEEGDEKNDDHAEGEAHSDEENETGTDAEAEHGEAEDEGHEQPRRVRPTRLAQSRSCRDLCRQHHGRTGSVRPGERDSLLPQSRGLCLQDRGARRRDPHDGRWPVG